MTRRALALASLVLAAASRPVVAYEPAMSMAPPPPSGYLVSIEEGAPWGEQRLYLRLFPPGKGVYRKAPMMAGTASGSVIRAFEVPTARHSPQLRPTGYAELGKIPEDGTYELHVSAGAAGARSFTLHVTPDSIRLEPAPDSGALDGDARDLALLEVGVPELRRLPRRAFTFRFDHPHAPGNTAIARRVWLGSLLGAKGVRTLNRPDRPLSDPEFESWLDDGAPLLVADDPREVYRVMTEMALETDSHVVLRWYGGLTWDLRDLRAGVCPEPCWLPNLDYLIPPHLR